MPDPEKKPHDEAAAMIRMLDAQMAGNKAKRESDEARRTTFRVGSIIVILVVTIIGLLLLQYALSELSKSPHRQEEHRPETSRTLK